MYKTLLFDMDGTVLDTLGDLTAAINYTMEKFGQPKHTLEEVKSYVGDGIVKLLERSIPNGRGAFNFDEQLETYKEYYAAHNRDLTRPYDGILELMKTAKDEGLNVGIVSNKHQSAVTELTKYYFGDLVDVAVGNRPDSKPKPDPAVVFEALNELGADPDTALYIGDSDVDARTAEAAGLDCVLVAWGFRDRTVLEKQKSVAVVDNVDELMAFLH